jgi:hypothetical protein
LVEQGQTLKSVKESFVEFITEYRGVRARHYFQRKNFETELAGNFKVDLVKGVFHSTMLYPEMKLPLVMHIMKLNEYRRVFKSKSPTTEDNYIGVEIECFTKKSHEDLGRMFFESGLAKYICVKSDGSVSSHLSGHVGVEVAVLSKESESAEIIEKVCEVLARAEAKVNKSCGLHVHLDMRNRISEIAFKNLLASQDILFAMNPYSRQLGTYCRKLSESNMFKVLKQGDRYCGINPTALQKYNTLEIRIHSGTVLDIKINNWIKILKSIINETKVFSSTIDLNQFFLNFNILDDDLKNYIKNRIKKFENDDKGEVEEKDVA